MRQSVMQDLINKADVLLEALPELPLFDVPVLPSKPMPMAVWRTLNAEFVRRLKVRGEYAHLRGSAVYRTVVVPFQLR